MAKIIIVEDDADLRQLLVDELEDAGHEAIEASDGVDGLNAILAETPDVIISDIGMPLMDGLELRQQLQQMPKQRTIPFLFVSALAFQHAIDNELGIGADHFLTKPVDFGTLLSRIEACVS